MRRRDSLLVMGCVALLGCALLIGIADGKKKGRGGGKLTVLTTQQHLALDTGAIKVSAKGRGGRVVVDGIQTNGAVALTTAKKVGPGKHTVNVPLSTTGRDALGGCSITGLRARFAKGKAKKKGKKSKGSRVTPLDRDLAVCSVGSENPTSRPYFGPPIDTSNANRCDFMDPALCLQPWPNDYFTVPDATTATGRRLALNPNSMPANQLGQHLDPTDINRNEIGRASCRERV